MSIELKSSHSPKFMDFRVELPKADIGQLVDALKGVVDLSKAREKLQGKRSPDTKWAYLTGLPEGLQLNVTESNGRVTVGFIRTSDFPSITNKEIAQALGVYGEIPYTQLIEKYQT